MITAERAVWCLRALADALEESERECASLPALAPGPDPESQEPDPRALVAPVRDARVVEIEGRLAASTPGPWIDGPEGSPWDGEIVSTATLDRIARDPEADDRPADRDLIAHAPDDIRYLLARVETLERFVAAWDACGGADELAAARDALEE